MAWGSNGVTNERLDLDQSSTFNWGGAAVPVNFQPVNPVGYLRKLWLKIPYTSGTLTLAATGNTVAVPAEKDFPVGRIVNNLSLILQGIAPIYQLSKGGLDLELLAYVGNGDRPEYRRSPMALQSNAATNTQSLGHTSDQWAYRKSIAVGTQQGSGPFTQAYNFALTYDLPLTEFVYFPGGLSTDSAGKTVSVPPSWQEVGLITAANTAVNLRPSLTLNPMYILTGGSYDTVLKATTAIPTAGAPTNVPLNFYKEFYDVPTNPADQPPAFGQQWVITRQTRDWPVATNAANPKFEQAGLLLRAIYLFTDTNDQIVDISGQATDGTIAFKWGSSVYKYNAEPFELNLTRAAEMYGEPPPAGTLYHDFFKDHSLTDVINTAELPAITTEIRGLPGSVTNCHVIEERMIPVKVG